MIRDIIALPELIVKEAETGIKQWQRGDGGE